MSVPFPVDPGLPGLPTLLNESAMINMLQAHGITGATNCTPRYVRYKPGTSCIVQYDLSTRDDAGKAVTQLAHIKIYEDGRGADKANRSRTKRLGDRLKDLDPDIDRLTYLPEVEGIFQIYPADVDLPSLARMSVRKDAQKYLQKSGCMDSGIKLSKDPELIRFKPGRKALFRYHLNDAGNSVLYGKTFEDRDVDLLARQTGELISAGIRTPSVRGTIERFSFIVHEEAKGNALNTLRGTETYPAAMKPLAEALWEMQGVEVSHLRVHTLEDEAEALRQVGHHLSHVIPAWNDRLTRIVESLTAALGQIEDTRQTAHGDFYDDQVLVSEDGYLALIDFDELRSAHPLLDAGNMLAHLTVAGLRGDDTGIAREVFREETRRHFATDYRTLDLFECVGLFKLAPGPFRRMARDWILNIERILDLVESRIAAFSGIDSRIPPRDEKLPQLETLRSGPKMREEFEALGLPGLVSVELTRHKPGRRAILKYGFDNGNAYYGKTFASKRGAKVSEIAEKLFEGNVFGNVASMPEPVAWIPERKLILTREVAGEEVEPALLNGDTDLATQVAFALYHLHSSSVDLGRWHEINDELKPLGRRCGDIAHHAPDLTGKARELLADLLLYDSSQTQWRYRPIHRDMYHDQVLESPDGLIVLDLDDASMSEPIIDIANFAAHLVLLGIQKHGDGTVLQRVIDTFVGQYKDLDGDFDDRLYSYLVATTLFRLTGIHVSREKGEQVARSLLEASQASLRQAKGGATIGIYSSVDSRVVG